MDRAQQTTAKRNPLVQPKPTTLYTPTLADNDDDDDGCVECNSWLGVTSVTYYYTRISCMLVLNGAPDVHLCAHKIHRGATMQWQEWNEHTAT